MDHFDLYRQLPDEWLGLDERQILQKLKRPTLFHCPGHDPSRAVVVSCLLHGNEPSGYIAVIEELKRQARGVSRYRFDVIYLIGNVEAAKAGEMFEWHRLDSQSDMNRVWRPGQEIADEWDVFIRSKNLIALLDLHNTSGQSQPFSVLAKQDEPTMRLANVLAGTHVLMPDAASSLISCSSKYAPAVAVECGKRMLGQSDEHARVTLGRFFLATQVTRGNPERYFFKKVYANVRAIAVQDGVPFFFGTSAQPGSTVIRKDLDRLNLMDAPAGEVIGWAPKNYLVYKKNQLSTDDSIDCVDGELRLKKLATIIMATPDERVAKGDCLLYIGEEMV